MATDHEIAVRTVDKPVRDLFDAVVAWRDAWIDMSATRRGDESHARIVRAFAQAELDLLNASDVMDAYAAGDCDAQGCEVTE